MRVLVLLMTTLLVGQGAQAGDPTTDFLAQARGAIGGSDALARVHSVDIAVLDDVMPDNGGRLPFNGGDWLGAGPMNDPGGKPRPVTHIWLAPPSRFLEVSGGHRAGFDGDRPVGTIPMTVKPWLWRWALPLFLDPATIGLDRAGESDEMLDRTAVHVVNVVASDGSFEARLFFALRSARLVMARFTIQATPYSGQTGSQFGGQEVTEQDSFGDYKRVRSNGVSMVLPFRIRREVQRTRAAVITEFDVVKYTLNPNNLDEQFK